MIGTDEWVKAIRKDFPIFERKVNGHPLVYFDNAATTQRPHSVIEAVDQFYRTYNANVHRGVHTLAAEATEAYEMAHKKVAKFIHAKRWREIVFTRNATEALNLVAYAWGLHRLKPGDNIVTTIMEHHSNLVPWQKVAKWTGATLRVADVTEEGRLNLDHLRSLIDEHTKVVAVTSVSNTLGVVNPIPEIARWAHEVGAIVVVDGAQGVPHIPTDVQAWDVDFLAASGHKMLGPTGIGFLYGKEDLLEEMEPFLFGGEMIREVWVDRATWNELPWKFEAGTPNIAGGIGLAAAVDYLMQIGMENIEAYERELTAYALERLKEVPGIVLYGPDSAEDRVGVLSFNLGEIHPHDVASILDYHGIAIRSGHHCAQPLMRRLGMEGAARISLYFYNTKEEIDLAVEVLHKALEIFA